MTNEQIIFSNRLQLMNSGVIGTTGRNIVIEDSEGRKTITKEPEEIHTYMEWKRRGYTVRHGEKCISRFTIWKNVPVKKEGEEPKEKMIMKEAFFFKASQVEKGEEQKAI
jgi:hypothetical protein